MFRTNTWQVVKTVKLPGVPKYVLVGPGGQWLLITNVRKAGGVLNASTSGSVTLIDAQTLAVLDSWLIGWSPHGVALSPDGRFLALTQLDEQRVDLLDAATLTRLASYRTGPGPEWPVFRSIQELWVSHLAGDGVTSVNYMTSRTSEIETGGMTSGWGSAPTARPPS